MLPPGRVPARIRADDDDRLLRWKRIAERKPIRFKNFDYNTTGAYFITICTQNRRGILSRIVGTGVLGDPKSVELLPYGIVADKYINQLDEFYENITVHKYVIMPNHIHLLLWVKTNKNTTITDSRGRLSLRTLSERTVRVRNLYRHLSVFATKNTEKIFGNGVFMTTLSATAGITKNT